MAVRLAVFCTVLVSLVACKTTSPSPITDSRPSPGATIMARATVAQSTFLRCASDEFAARFVLLRKISDTPPAQVEVGACDTGGTLRIEYLAYSLADSEEEITVIGRDNLQITNADRLIPSDADLSGVSLVGNLGEGRVLKIERAETPRRSRDYLVMRVFKTRSDGSLDLQETLVDNGWFTFGSPFTPCDMGDPLTSIVNLGSAQITFFYCQGFGTSGGLGKSIIGTKVFDSDPAAASFKSKEQMFMGDLAKNAITEKTHHHNICDSIQVKGGSATYTITAGPIGVGSPGEIENNCKRADKVFLENPEPQSGNWGSVYEIKYTDAPATVRRGRIANPHYLMSITE